MATADGQAMKTTSSQAAEILKALKKGHPRLFVTPEQLRSLREEARIDPVRQKQLADICKQSDRMLKSTPVKYFKGDMVGLIRICLDRVSTLAFAWLMTDDRKYADRAMKELEAAAAFPDWNPSHFLDTAEMTCAFGIGYGGGQWLIFLNLFFQ